MRLLCLALALFLVGCGGSPRTGAMAELAGTAWTVERIVYPTGEVIRGGGETLAFGTDGSLSMSSCNSCQGRYRARRVTVEIRQPLACTRRACATDAVELERFIGGVQRVERDGAYLVLTTVYPEGEEPQQGGAPSVLLLPQSAE